MSLLLLALGLLGATAVLSLLAGARTRWASGVGATGAIVACALGLTAALHRLAAAGVRDWSYPWLTPLGGAFHLGADALSALFLIPLFLVGGLAALFGARYLAGTKPPGRVAAAWCFYNLLLASMAIVFLARNALLFLVAWEIMAVTSFFLVTFEHEDAAARLAGRIYLIATHLGTGFLVVFMLIMARVTGSLEFDAWRGVGAALPTGLATGLFICALIGFGTKAGLVPLHIWLPEAHPAAPSHVSAVMSGVMIKTGIYGLFRLLPCLGAPPLWWGWVLVAVGLSTGLLGVLFALAQQDIKRLLAYSSVENMGLIVLAMGIGYLGFSSGLPLVAALGFAGALLHVLNHALFKSLLFLGAGAVYHATGTRELDRLGGLLKSMPTTGLALLVGSVAIAGLPPLNGFASEFTIYAAGLLGSLDSPPAVAVPLMLAVAGLALIGGLAAACFTRLFGMAFLGVARSDAAAAAHEAAPAMRWPLLALAACCGGLGLTAPWTLAAIRPALASVTGAADGTLATLLAPAGGVLTAVTLAAGALVLLLLALAGLRRVCLRGREIRRAVTWDCGYAAPRARMQYTASSFAQPIVLLFGDVLRSRRRFRMGAGYFPASGELATETRDVFSDRLYTPLFLLVDRWVSFLKWMQAGRVQIYVLYIVVTLLVLLFIVLGARA